MTDIVNQISQINYNISKINNSISNIEIDNKINEPTLLKTYPLRPNDLLRMEEKARNLFDVIICGGGTAGCVMAARLTEEPNNKVLLIECGSDIWRSMESNWDGATVYIKLYKNV
jgi:NAD kinase